MRRKDREVTSPEAIREIIDACKVFRVAFMGEDFPYVVPLNFGYTWEEGQLVFYFHCASQGRKLDLMRKNPRVAFEMDCGHDLMESDVPCGYGYRFQSVMGCGLAQEVTDVAEKKAGLSCLMAHQTGKAFSFTDQEAEQVTVCRVLVQALSAKARNSM